MLLTNDAFLRLPLRAESNDRSKLIATFVDAGPLFTRLSSRDHQVLYGRRGTGKTHALSFLAGTKQNEGHVAVYIDLRTIGSTGGMYGDQSVPLSQRATSLLVDMLRTVHDELREFFIQYAEPLDLSLTGPFLNELATALMQVKVVGSVEQELTQQNQQGHVASNEMTVGLSEKGLTASTSGGYKEDNNSEITVRRKEAGTSVAHVVFGSVRQAFQNISSSLGGKQLWLLLDEWSSIPLDLQPYLADLLRRSVFPTRNITVKIAAIEQRTKFRIPTSSGDYVGVELGADIAANLNLDDFMVFDNDVQKSKQFFKDLLYRHYKETEGLNLENGPNSSDELIKQAFALDTVFDEYVRATEGVPRDAINIISSAAEKASTSKISVNDVRTAARNWYQRDKSSPSNLSEESSELLQWIISEVIGERRARAFLLSSKESNPLIDKLFDARIIHVLKQNISAIDRPGIRYTAYKLDYGCYVDLINTMKSPQGTLPFDDDHGNDGFTDVPPDDYRAIRRAVLDLKDFYNRRK